MRRRHHRGAEPLGAEPAGLSVRDVRVCYSGTEALRVDRLDVSPGEWVALIGPNGAGKSSLLRAVAGVIPVDGTITVADHPIQRLRPRDRARAVAVVPQHPVIPADMTATEYVLLGRTAHLDAFAAERPIDLAVAAETLAALGIEALAGRPLATLSGGERQRVVLARALAQAAPVLVLDEPTSALDLGHQQQVLELVDEQRRGQGLAVLSALHDLTLAAQYADRLVLLDRGVVVDDGPPATVLEPLRLAAVFGTEIEVIADERGVAVLPRRRRHA